MPKLNPEVKPFRLIFNHLEQCINLVTIGLNQQNQAFCFQLIPIGIVDEDTLACQLIRWEVTFSETSSEFDYPIYKEDRIWERVDFSLNVSTTLTEHVVSCIEDQIKSSFIELFLEEPTTFFASIDTARPTSSHEFGLYRNVKGVKL